MRKYYQANDWEKSVHCNEKELAMQRRYLLLKFEFQLVMWNVKRNKYRINELEISY